MLVLDTNILIRAVLGRKVQQLLVQYGSEVQFYCPESAFAEALEHLPHILAKRSIPVSDGMVVLEALTKVVQSISLETLSPFEASARERMCRHDEEDWPVLAAAMALGCAIWTEDKDFFGSGVATWTTDRVEIYLQNIGKSGSLE